MLTMMGSWQDEISTGLDSATTFQIVRNLRDFAHLADATVVVALLQPAPEVFDLFDDVMLLSEGEPASCSPLLWEAAQLPDSMAV